MDPWTWALIAMVVASTITTVATSAMSGGKPAKPASLEDFKVPQADEGTPQPVVFGDVWTDGWMVLWYGDLKSEPIKGGSK